MKILPLVKDYMTATLHTLKAETAIYEAVEFLLRHKISGAPVIDEFNNLVGIISEKDCLQLLSQGVKDEALKLKVADFMSSKVETVLPDLDIYQAAAMFLKTFYRRFPVVTKDGKLAGQISRSDILRAIHEIRRFSEMKGEFAAKAQFIEKEEVSKLIFPKGEVLATDEEVETRRTNLENAARLGNNEHYKVKIVFSAEEGLLMVYTTIWAVTKYYISLKGGIAIPINRIYEVIF